VRRAVVATVIAGLTGLAINGVSLTATAARQATVTLRIYDHAGLPVATSAGLQAAAATALARAAITLDWRFCATSAPERHARCAAAPEQREIVVRIVERHDGLGSTHCGVAWPRPAGGGFISLARTCAARTAMALMRGSPAPAVVASEAEVLGYTLAHEVAHVLLPGSPHSRDGLFRARLDRRHWRRLRTGHLTFLRQDALRLSDAASRR
jgi:hypothetical protein